MNDDDATSPGETDPQERIRSLLLWLLISLLAQIGALLPFGAVFTQQYLMPPPELLPGQDLPGLKPLLGLVVGLTVLSGALCMKILLARQEREDGERAALHSPMGTYAFVIILLPLVALFLAEAKPGWYFGLLIFSIPFYATLPLTLFHARLKASLPPESRE